MTCPLRIQKQPHHYYFSLSSSYLAEDWIPHSMRIQNVALQDWHQSITFILGPNYSIAKMDQWSKLVPESSHLTWHLWLSFLFCFWLNLRWLSLSELFLYILREKSQQRTSFGTLQRERERERDKNMMTTSFKFHKPLPLHLLFYL